MDTQYRTIVERAGWADREDRGRLRFEGADAVSFLQALVTNDLEPLREGDGVYAAYLTPQGRMIADLEICHRGSWLMVGVPGAGSAALASRFDQLVFSEDVHVTDVSDRLSEISVVGGDAASIVGRVMHADQVALAALSELGQLDGSAGFVVRGGDARLPNFRVVMPRDERAAIVARLEAEGSVAIGHELTEALRIDVGRPAFGPDMTEETIPLEAGLLERAISTSKGCYVGQEVVIRILHRGGGRVARRLVTLAFDMDTGERPLPGSNLMVDDRVVGRTTSVAPSLSGDGFVGIGIVHRDAAETGRDLVLEARNGTAAVTGFTR